MNTTPCPAVRGRLRPVRWIVSIAVLSALGCGGSKPPQELPAALMALKDDPAGALILQSIQACGGWEAWSEKETVEYDVEWTPFLEDGSPGETGREHHALFLTGPRIRGRIDRPDEDMVLADNGYVAWAARDGGMRADPAMEGPAQTYIQRVVWIFRLPFNLAERTVRLVDEGSEGSFRKIKIEFPIGMGVMKEDWARIYLDENTMEIRQLFLNSAEGRTWMEFLDLQDVDGILVPHRRRVYHVNPDGSRGAVSHEIVLRNVKFNVPLEEASLDPPESYTPPPPATPAPGTGSGTERQTPEGS